VKTGQIALDGCGGKHPAIQGGAGAENGRLRKHLLWNDVDPHAAALKKEHTEQRKKMARCCCCRGSSSTTDDVLIS
jgi:hypothetical protein